MWVAYPKHALNYANRIPQFALAYESIHSARVTALDGRHLRLPGLDHWVGLPDHL